jgi:hypothetical protein
MKVEKNNNPQNYLQTFELSVGMVGAGLTSKNQPFNFYNKGSDMRNTIIDSWQLTLWYGNRSEDIPVLFSTGSDLEQDQISILPNMDCHLSRMIIIYSSQILIAEPLKKPSLQYLCDDSGRSEVGFESKI